MENNLFYSKGSSKKNSGNKNFNFKSKKEKTLSSLNEVENFLINYKNFMKYVKLYNWFKN